MSGALLGCGASALAGDLALLVGIHCGETAVASARAFRVVRHPADLQRYWETKCSTDYIRFADSKRSLVLIIALNRANVGQIKGFAKSRPFAGK